MNSFLSLSLSFAQHSCKLTMKMVLFFLEATKLISHSHGIGRAASLFAVLACRCLHCGLSG